MKPVISSHADHRPSDYRFARQRSGSARLEPTQPLQAWSADLRAAIVTIGVIALLWAAAGLFFS